MKKRRVWAVGGGNSQMAAAEPSLHMAAQWGLLAWPQVGGVAATCHPTTLTPTHHDARQGKEQPHRTCLLPEACWFEKQPEQSRSTPLSLTPSPNNHTFPATRPCTCGLRRSLPEAAATALE